MKIVHRFGIQMNKWKQEKIVDDKFSNLSFLSTELFFVSPRQEGK